MKWSDYSDRIKTALDNFLFEDKIIDILRDSKKHGQTIYIAGNGGSAALASHYQNDFSKGASKPDEWKENKRNRYSVVNLSSDIGYITAIANDTSYDQIFKQQLVNTAKADDILILISASGNSPNILEAARYGKEIGMIIIGITGFFGGNLSKIADYNAHIGAESYEVVEDIHAIFGHFLTICMREEPTVQKNILDFNEDNKSLD